MAFNLGGLAQGLASGAETGMDLRSKAMMIKEAQQRLDAAKQAVAQQAAAQAGAANMSLAGDGSGGGPQAPQMGAGPPPGAGGTQPPPMQGGSPQQAPMPGAQQMPPGAMAPQGPPPGPGGVQPMQPPPQGGPPPPAGVMPGGGGSPPGGAPPAPGGQMPSQVPPASSLAPNAAAGLPPGQTAPPPPDPNMSGTANGIQNPDMSSQHTLTMAYRDAKAANPGASPAELTRIVDYRISQLKGLGGEEKASLAYYQAQARIAGIQAEHDRKTASDEEKVRHDRELEQARQDAITAGIRRTAMTQDGAMKRQQMKDLTSKMLQTMRDDTQTSMHDNMIKARDKWVNEGLDDADFRAEMTAQLKQQGASDSFVASVFRSETGADPTLAKTPPKEAGSAPLPSPPQRGGNPRPASGGQPPAASSTPPISALKEGVHTKFSNGQVWTLQNKKPVRIS